MNKNDRINIHYAGLTFPGIVVSEPWLDSVTLASGRTIRARFADVVSLRTPNPVGPNAKNPPYLRWSIENLSFCTLRAGAAVVGLDADKHGAVLNDEDRDAIRAQGITARQAERVAVV